MTERAERCRAVLLGQGLGDAVGELAFRHRDWASLTAAAEAAPLLRWTDDTAMAVVLAEHLLRHPQVHPERLGAAFEAAYREAPWRGYGQGPVTVFRQAAVLGSYRRAAQTLFGGRGSLGNGAAMRAAPVGLAFWRDPQALDRAARAQAVVTHAHPVAQDGAAMVARAVAEALAGAGRPLDREAFLDALADHAWSLEMGEALDDLADLLLEETPSAREVAAVLGHGVAAQASVPFALWCFLRHPDDWLAQLRCAALHAADRDTVAAMCGAMGAARLGRAGLPEGWLARLEDRARLATLGAALCRCGVQVSAD